MPADDTIAAIATAAGRAAIGVVRVSGPAVPQIATGVLGALPAPRHAQLADFRGRHGEALDRGIALYFPAPGSYTGEDVLELQGHGGPVVLSLLLARCLELGARPAQPGEFTRRALLHDKLDLMQAEAVADLIEAASDGAARSAARSLSGQFSTAVVALQQKLTEARALLEASFDFSEDEIAALTQTALAEKLAALSIAFEQILAAARSGKLLRDGLEVALVGPPNVGKSSVMNALAREPVAIVTAIPGTTRDLVRTTIVVSGVPVHLTDTAGLRETDDPVESIGIGRAREAAQHADLVVAIRDVRAEETSFALDRSPKVLHVHNKIDLAHLAPRRVAIAGEEHIWLSATERSGLELLTAALLEQAGGAPAADGTFSARQRHLDGLRRSQDRVRTAAAVLHTPEFAAEELRLAQQDLSVLTGEQLSDDLLGEIFSRFCIGK